MDQHTDTDTENGRGSVAPALVAHADATEADAEAKPMTRPGRWSPRFGCIPMSWAPKLRKLGGNAYAVAHVLWAYNWGKTNKVHPGPANITRYTEIADSRNQTRVLRRMEAEGLLRLHAPEGQGSNPDIAALSIELFNDPTPVTSDGGSAGVEAALTPVTGDHLTPVTGDPLPPSPVTPRRKESRREEEESGAPSPSSTSRTADPADPADPADVRAVLLRWEWTDERIDGALWHTGYRWKDAVADVAKRGIWKPYENRVGGDAEKFLELLKAVERAQKWLQNRAGAKPPAAVTAPEERRTEPVASDQAQHAEEANSGASATVEAVVNSGANSGESSRNGVPPFSPSDELELVQAAGGHAVDIVMAKASGRPFDLHKLLAELEAKHSRAQPRGPSPAKAPTLAPTLAAEDDAQPPADDPARGFDIPESLRERMIPANPADLAGVRFHVPPFLTFDGDDQRVLLLIGVQLHAIAGRPGGPDLPTCRRHTVKMYESMGRRWHESGGVLVPVGVTIESAA